MLGPIIVLLDLFHKAATQATSLDPALSHGHRLKLGLSCLLEIDKLLPISSHKMQVRPGLHVLNVDLFGALRGHMRHVCGVLDTLPSAGCTRTTAIVSCWVILMQQHQRDYALSTIQLASCPQQCLLPHFLAFYPGHGFVSKLPYVAGLDLVHMSACLKGHMCVAIACNGHETQTALNVGVFGCCLTPHLVA